MKRLLFLVLLIVAFLSTAHSAAGDWPMFRYDVGRTAASPHELPGNLELRWTRVLPPPQPAFPLEYRLAYDASYEPVVVGHTMYVPSMVTDCVTALDTETGEERWRFFAEGPVRFAPVAWEGRVYFVADDGHLYCVDGNDGSLRWKFRGLPEGKTDRRVIGHGRLISLWPARGGPVLADGVVYFAAGLWPTEGVFVHAVDADSGKSVWSNTDCHHIPKSNFDHGVGQYAGLMPQGYLAIVGDRLIVPCGTQLPAFFDLKTGKQTGRIDLPKHLETPWTNLRLSDDYLLGNSGPQIVCVQRRTGEMLWTAKAARAELSLAVGGNKVFCAELPDPRRGENEARDGSMFALNIATGERVWQKASSARLRYSPSLDIVVTPTGFYRGSDGELLPRKTEARPARLVIQGKGLPKSGLPGFIAGRKLLTGNEENLIVYDIPSGDPIGKPLKWARRGCTGTRASTHLLTTRYRSNSAWIDLESREITPLLGVRPGCSVNNNLYPANGVLNIPNLTAGCTCNFAPMSVACVPAAVVQHGGTE